MLAELYGRESANLREIEMELAWALRLVRYSKRGTITGLSASPGSSGGSARRRTIWALLRLHVRIALSIALAARV